VHEHQRGPGRGDNLCEAKVVLQVADVVDDRRAAGHRLARHAALVSVHADRHVHHRGEPLDHRQHPAQFLVFRQRRRAGSRRLAANVDDVRSIRNHAPAVGHGGLEIEVQPTIRERIGGHVEDAHDQRPLPEPEGRTAGQRNVEALAGWKNHRLYERKPDPLAGGP
jgi:hypothetical protein